MRQTDPAKKIRESSFHALVRLNVHVNFTIGER